MRRGDIVTPAALSARFDMMYRKANNLTSSDFKALSTGQVFIIGLYSGSTPLYSEVMSVSCEQFFDTKENIDYICYDDGLTGTYGTGDLLQSITDKITELENR